MNYIQQINGFWERVNVDERLTPVHKALYFSLLHINNLSSWKPKFTAIYREVMHYSSIKSMTTYYSVLNDLKEWGYIEYEKGKNQYDAATFALPVLYQNLVNHLDNQLMNHEVKQTETNCESSDITTEQSSSQSTGDILKLINNTNLETNKPLNLETSNISVAAAPAQKTPLEKIEDTAEAVIELHQIPLDESDLNAEKNLSKKKEKIAGKKKESKAHPAFAAIKGIFMLDHPAHFWDARDATQLNKLIEKIEFSNRAMNVEPTAEVITDSFTVLKENLPNWMIERKMFTIAHINSQYNNIVNQGYGINKSSRKLSDLRNEVERFTRKGNARTA